MITGGTFKLILLALELGVSQVVSFPDPPALRAKEGLVYKVRILGCADSAVVGKLRNKT